MFACQMGKHIPGNPDIIVQNMTGAGGLIAANYVYGVARPMVATPGIPADRVKILRGAYNRALNEPELVEEAKKRRWIIEPVSAGELEALAKEVITQPPEIIERMKKLLGK